MINTPTVKYALEALLRDLRRSLLFVNRLEHSPDPWNRDHEVFAYCDNGEVHSTVIKDSVFYDRYHVGGIITKFIFEVDRDALDHHLDNEFVALAEPLC